MESVTLLFKKLSQKKKSFYILFCINGQFNCFFLKLNLSFYLTLTWGFNDKMKNMIYDKYAKKLILFFHILFSTLTPSLLDYVCKLL